MKHNWIVFLSLVSLGCGTSGSLQFTDVVGIPAGDGYGVAFSGDYALVLKINNNSCEDADLETPAKDTNIPVDVTVVQTDGALTLGSVDEVFFNGILLSGGVNVDEKFRVGGADVVDRGTGQNNILRLLRMDGRFKSKDLFEGDGEEQLIGDLEGVPIDCRFTFSYTSNRSPS